MNKRNLFIIAISLILIFIFIFASLWFFLPINYVEATGKIYHQKYPCNCSANQTLVLTLMSSGKSYYLADGDTHELMLVSQYLSYQNGDEVVIKGSLFDSKEYFEEYPGVPDFKVLVVEEITKN